MTRQEYLDQLGKNLTSLTNDEREEALSYYSDYFEDADNDEEIMKELGSPEELAKTIESKLANSLAKAKSSEKDSESTEESSDENSGHLFYSFEKSQVRNLTLTFSAAEVVAIPGDYYAVESLGLAKESLSVQLASNGSLNIYNNKRVNFNFWSHDRQERVVPRILVTIPDKAKINRLKINLGAGSFEAKEINLTFEEGHFEVGAGNLSLGKISGKNSNFRCGMGKLSASGIFQGNTNLDCGMGNIVLDINGREEDYSYDAKVGLGEVKFNNQKKTGFLKYYGPDKKDNHLSINCGIGKVEIKFSE
ncbi:MAG: DUF1700 domain-containing protein [Treponema sp.]|nr:DUF1700 domain-containing protein [Treponema sp.]